MRRDVDSVRIGKMAGVSRSTVSKVINNYPDISEATRARVQAAIREHQYYPALSAQVLAGKKTGTIGLFFANTGHFSEDVLVNFMISSMIEAAGSFGYHMLTYIIRRPGEPLTADSVKEVFYQGRVDAGVFLGFPNVEPTIEQLISQGFAVGVFDQDLAGRSERNRVVVLFDDARTAAACIDRLAALGHRRIAIIHGDRMRHGGQARYEGFLDGMARNGLEVRDEWMLSGDFGRENARLLTRSLIERGGELPTAIAAANDAVAFGAMEAMQAAGLRIPENISIIGMDGHPLGGYVRPGLTTFAFDFRAMFETLISGVVSVVEGSPAAGGARTVFPATFVERQSCRRI
jgi:LacI family transcriptional regulator